MNQFADIREIATMSRADYEKACLEHTDHIYLGNDTVLCKVLTRYKMFVNSRDLGIAPHLMMDGYWESWLTQLLAQTVKPGFVCLDIGANFGYYSLLMSELAGKNGRTISVEPNPLICDHLRATEFLHGWHFEVVQAAVADKKGEAVLTITDRELGGGTIKPNELIPGRTQVTVPTLSVDNLVAELGLSQVDMIKIDVEGVEPQVFAGMRDTIRKNRGVAIIMEYSPSIYTDAEEFTNFLFSEFVVHQVKDVDKMVALNKYDIPRLVAMGDHTDLFLRPL